MNYIEIEGVKTPYKLTNRAKYKFEKQNKIMLATMEATFENVTKLALAALNEGAELEGIKDRTFDKLLDLDAKSENPIIDEIIENINGDRGKPKASTNEA